MANYRDERVEFDCELVNETSRSWIVDIDGEQHAIPKSISVWTPSRLDAVDGIIEIPQWKADELGLG